MKRLTGNALFSGFHSMTVRKEGEFPIRNSLFQRRETPAFVKFERNLKWISTLDSPVLHGTRNMI